MIKRILSTCLLLSSINALAVPFTDIPCDVDVPSGLITNTIGYDVSDNLCDFKAEQLKLKVYKIALCTQAPSFSRLNQPDFSSCSFIYNNDTYSEITVSASTGFNLSGLTKPAAGTYRHILLVTSNDVKIKAQARFSSTLLPSTPSSRETYTSGGGSGSYCWTNGSVINYVGAPTKSNKGLSCGNAVDSSYGFNEINWASNSGNSDPSEPVPGGVSVRSLLTANLLLTTVKADIIRTAYVNTLDDNITITENTNALKMSIDISTGASLVFNGVKIDWIEDAPFAYIIEPVNQ
jgi:hypothetical protein